jgi:hypothetical protein
MRSISCDDEVEPEVLSIECPFRGCWENEAACAQHAAILERRRRHYHPIGQGERAELNGIEEFRSRTYVEIDGLKFVGAFWVAATSAA